MKFLLLFIIQFLFHYNVKSEIEALDSGSVTYVSLLWRHGERNPVKFYVKDIYKNESFWPEGLGQLTNNGKRQHYELGKWLRSRYDSLLTEEFSPERVYVQSTDVDRTIMSAQVNLAGMFPPGASQVWDKRLPWQPIPVHTVPATMEKLIVVDVPCPAYDKELERVSSSDEIRRVYDQFQDVVESMRENAGGSDFNFTYIHDTWDTLTIEKRKGYAIPKWAEDLLPRLHEIAVYRFTVESWTKKLQRLKSGLLIKDMVDNMRNRAKNSSNRVVKVYSGHDLTVVNFLNALDVFDGHIPTYAACVMLELHQDKRGDHYVMLYYRNSSQDPVLLKLPGCASVCPLDQFISLVQPVIPVDWDKECLS